MTKIIRDWKGLIGLTSSKGYKIEVEDCCGWIVPIKETTETEASYFDHHVYLSTHTFYGSQYKNSTELLQKYGFDVEVDNWDKNYDTDYFIRNIDIMRAYFQMIIDLGVDYDGLNTVDSLKGLIDELVKYAKLGFNYDDKESISYNENKKYNILGEELEDNDRRE